MSSPHAFYVCIRTPIGCWRFAGLTRFGSSRCREFETSCINFAEIVKQFFTHDLWLAEFY